MYSPEQLLFVTVTCLILIGIVYTHTGWVNIYRCYQMWFAKKYWTAYNIVEAVSWLSKAIAIVPGLVFGVNVWWVYWLTLLTSLTLIWASNQKLLPTLVAFNTLWVWLSLMVLSKQLIQ
jgi:hypothetical protein